ncbi:hypothetical protein ACFL6Y_07960 [Elusimicrobiota bacterium]
MITNLASMLWSLCVCSLIFTTGGSIGTCICGYLGIKDKLSKNPLEMFIFSSMSGFGILIYLLWFLGRFGFFKWWILLFVFIVINALLYKHLISFFTVAFGLVNHIIIQKACGLVPRFFVARQLVCRSAEAGYKPPRYEENQKKYEIFDRIMRKDFSRTLKFILVFFIFVVLAQTFFINQTPPVERDDLSYHLYLPKAYVEMGDISPPPYPHRQAFYHQMLNMSYVPGFAFGSDTAAQAMNFCWSIMFFIVLLGLSKRLSRSMIYGVFAFALVLSAAFFRNLMSVAVTDMPAACFTLAGLLALFAFEDERKKMPYLVLSAFLTSLAMTKYTAGGYGLCTCMIFAIKNIRTPKLFIKGALLYFSFTAAALLPLCFYLYQTTGNPFYPIPIGFDLPYDRIEYQIQEHMQTRPGNMSALAKYFWNDWLDGKTIDAHPLLALAPLILLYPAMFKNRLGLFALWGLCGFLFRFHFFGFVGVYPRYILPTHATWAFLAAAVFYSEIQKARWRKILLMSILAFTLTFPFLLNNTLSFINPLRLNLGLSSKTDFLNHYYKGESWDMVEKINALVPGSRVAVLDHHFTPYYYNDLGSGLWQVPYGLMTQDDADKIKQELRSRSITHVLFVRRQWVPEKTGSGITFHGRYYKDFIKCLWWSKNMNLGFLKVVHLTEGGVLFAVKK